MYISPYGCWEGEVGIQVDTNGQVNVNCNWKFEELKLV